MIHYIKVTFEQAQVLTLAHYNVFIYDPSTGDAFNFNNPEW